MPERKKRVVGGPSDGKRRDLIMACAGVAGLGAVGFAASAQQCDELIRPPGAPAEKEFLELCMRCDRCRSVCPTSVIAVGGIFDGIRNMRTPKMNFMYGYCDFCGKCVDVCQTGALKPFDKKTEKIGLAVLTESCIALRTGACTKCYEECPFDAITLDKQHRPIIDPAVCNGCGKCEVVCPANVFQSSRNTQTRGIIIEKL